MHFKICSQAVGGHFAVMPLHLVCNLYYATAPFLCFWRESKGKWMLLHILYFASIKTGRFRTASLYYLYLHCILRLLKLRGGRCVYRACVVLHCILLLLKRRFCFSCFFRSINLHCILLLLKRLLLRLPPLRCVYLHCILLLLKLR